MTFRAALLILAIAILLLPAVAVATPTPTADNATTTPSATPTPTPNVTETPTPVQPRNQLPPRRYEYPELTRSGIHDDTAPPSVRFLGDGFQGSMSLRYRDPTLLSVVFGSSPEWQFMPTGTRLTENKLQVFATASPAVAGEYTLELVYWNERTAKVSVGNSTRTIKYAANQTVQKKQIVLESGYSVQNLSIKPHHDQAVQVSAILKRGGRAVPGARWRFTHLSNPTTQDPGIRSLAAVIGYTLRNAVIPGLLSVIVGLGAAAVTLRRTGRGPGYGVAAWLFGLALVAVMLSGIAYWQIAVILTNLPWVLGILIGLVAYGAGLTMHNPVYTVAFQRLEIQDAKELPNADLITDGGTLMEDRDPGWTLRDQLPLVGGNGADTAAEEEESTSGGIGVIAADEYVEELYRDLPEKPVVRREDDDFAVPVTGVRPWIARFFADAASLDITSFQTRMPVDVGDIDEIIAVDPKSEEAVEHEPARLERHTPLSSVNEESGTRERVWAYALTAALTVGPPAIGWVIGDSTLGLPLVGALAALPVSYALTHTAADGYIEFDPEPIHFRPVRNTLIGLQKGYKEAKTEEEGYERAARERATTAKEAREQETRERTSVLDAILEDRVGMTHSENGHEGDDE